MSLACFVVVCVCVCHYIGMSGTLTSRQLSEPPLYITFSNWYWFIFDLYNSLQSFMDALHLIVGFKSGAE